MPTLGQETQKPPIKMLVLAHSGFGKTGGLASLAKAGYKLHIVDFDNGIPILMGVLDKQFWPNVEYETCTDLFRKAPIAGYGKKMAPSMIPLSAQAWEKGMTVIEKWAGQYNTDQDVLAIDSLTHMGNAAVRQVLDMNNRLNMPMQLQDWGVAQAMCEGVLGFLYSASVKCNVIVNAHVQYQGGKSDPNEPDNADNIKPIKGFPLAPGQALSPKVGTYFNNMLVGTTLGSGASAIRALHTSPCDLIDAKTSAPKFVKESYPLANGLADFFADLRKAS